MRDIRVQLAGIEGGTRDIVEHSKDGGDSIQGARVTCMRDEHSQRDARRGQHRDGEGAGRPSHTERGFGRATCESGGTA